MDEQTVSTHERIGTLILSAVFFVFGIFWVIAASRMEARVQFGDLNLKSFPIGAGILLSSISLILFIRHWRLPSCPAKELCQDPFVQEGSLHRIILSIAIFTVYIWLLDKVSYFITTFIAMSCTIALFGEKSKKSIVLSGLAISLAMYIIFIVFLSVPLPR